MKPTRHCSVEVDKQLDSVQDGTLLKNYFRMFPMIVRLRQVVDHHYYGSLTELASGNKEAGDVEQACDLCQDAVEDPVVQELGAPFNFSLSAYILLHLADTYFARHV